MRIAVTPISVAGDTDGIGETRNLCDTVLYALYFS